MKTLINRRRFLQGGVAASAAATLSLAKTSQAATFEGYPNAMGVLVDLSRCVGCRSCEAACNKEQKLPAPEKPFNDVSVFEELHHGQKRRPDETRYTVVNRYEIPGREHPLFRKIQCNHCQEPACLTSCFVNAYTKTPEGAVVYDSTVCVGCRTCMVACPFNIPAFRYSSAFNPRIMKCIFCHDTRLAKGQPPACVEACPQEALTFGRRSDLVAMGRQRFVKIQDRMSITSTVSMRRAVPPGYICRPCLLKRPGSTPRCPRNPFSTMSKIFCQSCRWS